MEYEDAPSGYVTLYNYKEPFMRYESGFGYLGVLLFDGEADKIQCHMCGDWFDVLQHHIRKDHGITAAEYKSSVGLNQRTALISETFRAKLIAAGTERFKNLRPGKKMSQATKDKIRATLKSHSLENKNITGTCPAQLIERLQKRYNELGYTPRIKWKEVPSFEALKKTFGSFEEACRVAGIPYRRPGQNLRKKGSKVLIKHKRYTDEELIEYLVRFKKIHGRNPSHSDSLRKLIPSETVYRNRFGTWTKALAKAFN